MLLVAALLVSACSGAGESVAPAVAPPAAEAATPEAPGLQLGDWTTYADPPAEELEPDQIVALDDDRWARVSAELACAGRVERGDAGAHRLAARRVLHHHETTAEAVMDYGIAVNLDPARATRLGALVATAAERCR